jgi:hypothetical protein
MLAADSVASLGKRAFISNSFQCQLVLQAFWF